MTSPALATTTDKGRFYTWKDEKYVSVTTVLKVLAKPLLVPWAAKLVAERAVEMADQLPSLVRADRTGAIKTLKSAPYQFKNKASVKGSAVHDIAERVANGEPMGAVEPDLAPYVSSFLEFVEDHKPEFIHNEVTVFSKKYRYAGTTDFIARLPRFDNGIFIGDYKTSKGLYPEVALQLAAYAHADFMAIDDREVPLDAFDGAVAVHLRKDGYSCVKVRCDEKVLDRFVAARNLWLWQEYEAGSVMEDHPA